MPPPRVPDPEGNRVQPTIHERPRDRSRTVSRVMFELDGNIVQPRGGDVLTRSEGFWRTNGDSMSAWSRRSVPPNHRPPPSPPMITRVPSGARARLTAPEQPPWAQTRGDAGGFRCASVSALPPRHHPPASPRGKYRVGAAMSRPRHPLWELEVYSGSTLVSRGCPATVPSVEGGSHNFRCCACAG